MSTMSLNSTRNYARPRKAWILPGSGQVIENVHPRRQCKGEYCCIHNPSIHHANSWPMKFLNGWMWRQCPSVGCWRHPDPDDVAFNCTWPNLKLAPND